MVIAATITFAISICYCSPQDRLKKYEHERVSPLVSINSVIFYNYGNFTNDIHHVDLTNLMFQYNFISTTF